jgi:phosphatidylinositol alpha-1,6-mannosyltransferase
MLHGVRRVGDAPSILLGLTGLCIDGGIASVSRCIARALNECIADGRVGRVDHVLLLEDPAQAAAPPLHGDQWLARGSQPRFTWQLWRAFRRRRHELVLFDLVGLARAILLPLPSFPPPRYALFLHGGELERARTGARARAIADAELLLANSEFTARILRRDFPAVTDRIRVVPLCIDPERAAVWDAEARAGQAAPREPAAIIVGRMWSEERGKGHDDLISAWPAVLASIPNAQLWIVGAGDDRPRLEQRVENEGLSDAIQFLGRVSDAELGALYARASVFAMPSRQEGFGLVYAEAMWHGLPCVGSTADAADQVIVDGVTGLLVPYGDVKALTAALGALLEDPARAAEMGEAGRHRARQHFGYERFRADLLKALGFS